jgi:hypothetical protein
LKISKVHINSLLLGLLFTGIISACVDPFDVDIFAQRSNIIVDGNINNLDEPQQIRIFRTDVILSDSKVLSLLSLLSLIRCELRFWALKCG